MRFALTALTAVIAMLIGGVAFAQEVTTSEATTSLEEGTTTQVDTTVSTTTVEELPTLEDMPFEVFKSRAVYQKERGHYFKTENCRSHERFHFPKSLREVSPTWRAEFLSRWRGKKEFAKSQSSRCLPTNPRELGKYLAATKYGWVGYQWTALDTIVMRESGWNPCRHYPSTTNCSYSGPSACGIPQANPCSKLLVFCGTATIGACSAYTQIMWMLRYIASRYGSPAGALANGSTY